jgi:hypothetical protein
MTGSTANRKHLGEQTGPTAFAEEYGDETAYLMDDNSGRQLVQVIHREAARELVHMLRCGLNASRSGGYSGNRGSIQSHKKPKKPRGCIAEQWII